ncbi:MAG: endonuclease/exonuclease/phosphatase family protein [Promethearchaeota archaeon]
MKNILYQLILGLLAFNLILLGFQDLLFFSLSDNEYLPFSNLTSDGNNMVRRIVKNEPISGLNSTIYKCRNNELLVMTLNMHTYQEENQEIKFDMIVDTIAELNMDFIALQECAQRWNKPKLTENSTLRIDNMAYIICQRLKENYQKDYYFVWDWAHIGFGVYEEGVAVLSKYPILDWESRYVSTSTDKGNPLASRMAIHANVDVPLIGKVNIFSTHLSWRTTETDEEQNTQIRSLKAFVAEKEVETSEPVLSIVCGDFNVNPTSDDPWSDGYKTMMENNTYIDTFYEIYPEANQKKPSEEESKYDTVKGSFPGRIDYVFMKKNDSYIVNASQIIFSPEVIGEVSDHHGVITKLRRIAEPYKSAGGFKGNILIPNGGEILSGQSIIIWTVRSDSYEHNFTYSLYYSSDGGIHWKQIEINLTNTGYLWDTKIIPSKSGYIIKVVVHSSDGQVAEDTTNGSFTIYNHLLTSPIILFPNGGDLLNESITITWTASKDSLNHTLYYSVYYSPNIGEFWLPIAINLTVSTTLWDTTSVSNGAMYLIKVNVTCIEGLTAEDTSDTPFTIRNHLLSPLTVRFPNGGETLRSPTRITWSQSIDTLNHSVFYSLYYSYNRGNSWILLADNLTGTLFLWDVSTAINSENCLIKVNATCSEGLITEDISDGFFTITGGVSLPMTSSRSAISHTSTTTPSWTIQILFPVTIFYILVKMKKNRKKSCKS